MPNYKGRKTENNCAKSLHIEGQDIWLGKLEAYTFLKNFMQIHS